MQKNYNLETTILKNAAVLDESFNFQKVDVGITGERITLNEINRFVEIIDLEGMYLIPGLIDTHIHGAYGVEVESGCEEGLNTMSKFEATQGATAFAPM